MLYAQVHLTLPAWVHEAIDPAHVHASDEEKVALAIALSRMNLEAGSGGPFGAAVFGPDDRVIAIGVNRVLPHACSVAHAEMMAYMLAQLRTQRATSSAPPAAWQVPFTQLQPLISGKPQTADMPDLAQRACTPLGSVGLSTLTQAG